MKQYKIIVASAALLLLQGCTAVSNLMNPFYESPKPAALLGERNDNALNGDKKRSVEARGALDSLATYQRASLPSPNKPVMYPAIVRLMWVPDRLNRYGDLVPAHYYYLRVLNDRPAVTDAFELESQLNGPHGVTSNSSNMPYAFADEKAK